MPVKSHYLPLLIWLLLGMVSCLPKTNVSDGFESPGLSWIWSSDRMVKEALQIQSQIVRSGHSAARITLNPGDVLEKGEGNSNDSERDELREATFLMSSEGKKYEFRFSLFLPANFPIVPTRLVIAQWKQYCGGQKECSDDSPVLAIRYISGKLHITLQNDSARTIVYQTTQEIRSKWLDFKFRIRFSRLNNGLVEAWLNENQVIDYHGVTCYSSRKGYGSSSRFYFKTGLYRDLMAEPMVIYVDEYSKKELTD